MFIADVFDVLLIDPQDGSTIATTTLQTGNITVAVQETEIRGGQGNQLLGVLHANRDITIDLTDAAFRYEWLAKQLGQSIVTGAGVAYAMPEFYVAKSVTGTDTGATASIQVTLPEVPLKDTLVVFDASGVKVTGFTVKDKAITFTSGVKAGDKVEVRTYQYATKASTETIQIDNSIFAKGVQVVLETLEIDGSENPLYRVQYQFDKASPTGNFNINTQAQKTAATQQFQLKVIKPEDSDIVGRILRIPFAA